LLLPALVTAAAIMALVVTTEHKRGWLE